MRLFEEQHYEILDSVAHEGAPELSVAPLAVAPGDLPSEWAEPLTASDCRPAIARLWMPLADRVPRIYRAFGERLSGVGLLRTDESGASLLYFFGEGDESIVLRGYLPALPSEIDDGRTPPELLDFYRIHDGWVHHHTGDGGPLPRSAWVAVTDLWPDVAWQHPPGDLVPDRLVVVYRDADDMALAFDASDEARLPVRCYADGSVEVLLDLWVGIDREIADVLDSLEWPAERASAGPQAFRPAYRFDHLLARVSERQAFAAHIGGGGVYEQAADLLLYRALLEKEGGGRRDLVVDYYRQALRHWCTGVELRSDVAPEELLDWFGVAHALEDPASAHFIATVPPTMWADDSLETLQARVLFCFYLHDDEHAVAFFDELHGLTFDAEEPEREAAIVANLLQAIAQRNAKTYDDWRNQALRHLCRTPVNQRALMPWNFRLSGFDAVAAARGLVVGGRQPGRGTV